MRTRLPTSLLLGTLLAAATFGTAARAQDYGDPSGRALVIAGDLRAVAADGERSWIDGGFGKSHFGPDRDAPADHLQLRARAIEGDVVWSPQIGWTVGATIAVVAQRGQEHAVDLSEGYLTWRRGPHPVQLSARAGLFWPPVSLEHTGPEWRVAETITPSAINSWIGEEVKVGGAEFTAATHLGKGRVSATVSLFGFNDTAGTLLAFRGWALHDEKATAFGRQQLPPLDAFMQYAQAPRTRPVVELDNRPGWYASLGWTPDPRLSLHALYYDNRGDPEAVDEYLQWGWRTRFTDLGATLKLGGTKLTAQGLTGSTQMGYPNPTRIWVDTDFRSAFLLASQSVLGGSVSGRVEAFGTRGHGSVLGADESEDGWAATLAARRPFGDHLSVLGEVLHIDSTREARTRVGIDPQQDQTVVQLALRLRS